MNVTIIIAVRYKSTFQWTYSGSFGRLLHLLLCQWLFKNTAAAPLWTASTSGSLGHTVEFFYRPVVVQWKMDKWMPLAEPLGTLVEKHWHSAYVRPFYSPWQSLLQCNIYHAPSKVMARL